MLTPEDVAKLPLEDRLTRLAQAPDQLAAAIAGQAEPILVRRPDAKNWAAKEVICHLRDTEALFRERFQQVLAMDEPRFVPAIDADQLAEDLQYLRNDSTEALGAFRRRRVETLTLLKGLAPAQWQRGGTHPTYGRRTMADIAAGMVVHDDTHLHQLRRALQGQA